MEQVAIALFGVAAIFLSQSKDEEWRKWACIVGMCGQPFWVVSAYQAEQFGVLILTGFYTVAWAKGIYTNWIAGSPH
jgi:hypothetical protein